MFGHCSTFLSDLFFFLPCLFFAASSWYSLSKIWKITIAHALIKIWQRNITIYGTLQINHMRLYHIATQTTRKLRCLNKKLISANLPYNTLTSTIDSHMHSHDRLWSWLVKYCNEFMIVLSIARPSFPILNDYIA